MDELVAFVRAQLDEDERVAQVANALSASPWTSAGTAVTCGEGFPLARAEDGEPVTAEHIARWNPARVLAEVEAKRELLDSFASDLADDSTDDTAQWRVRLLARPYAGRPGWREEWSA